MNQVAYCPYDPSHVLGATDVSGLAFSATAGRHWQMNNGHVTSAADRCSSTVFFHPDGVRCHGFAFALIGDGKDGAVLFSDSFGEVWERHAFSGLYGNGNNTTVKGLPRPHPRSVGRLIDCAVAPTWVGSTLYVGSFKGGLFSTDLESLVYGEPAWQVEGGKGAYIRSVVCTPSGTVFTTEHTAEETDAPGSVWRRSDPDAEWVELTGLTDVEELRFVGGDLFGTLHDYELPGLNGVYQLVDAEFCQPDAAWHSLLEIPAETCHIDARLYPDGITAILATTYDAPDKNALWYGESSVNFDDGGAWVPFSGNVVDDEGGPNEPPIHWDLLDNHPLQTMKGGVWGIPSLHPQHRGEFLTGGRVMHKTPDTDLFYPWIAA